MPLPPRIYQHQAWERPIADSGSGGLLRTWPTSKARRADNASQFARGNPNQAKLAESATAEPPEPPEDADEDGSAGPGHLRPWNTPTAQDGQRGGAPPRAHDTGVPLSQQAATATAEPLPETVAGDGPTGTAQTSPWPTPTASEGKGGPAVQTRDHGPRIRDIAATATKNWGTPRVTTNAGRGSAKRANGPKSRLEDQATASSPEPRDADGGRARPADNHGSLSPDLPRWLQGYPRAWGACAPEADADYKTVPPDPGTGEPGNLIEDVEADPGRDAELADRIIAELRTKSPWAEYDRVWCTYDGDPRRVERGTLPVEKDVLKRAQKLAGYGNSIVPQIAAVFVTAHMTLPGQGGAGSAQNRRTAPTTVTRPDDRTTQHPNRPEAGDPADRNTRTSPARNASRPGREAPPR